MADSAPRPTGTTIAGAPGPAGPAGPAGTLGIPGTPGIPGTLGTSGAQAAQGAPAALAALCPAPPHWRLDWQAADAAFPWLRALEGCPQDPAWHGEGDAAVHTRIVCEELSELAEWRALPAGEREQIFVAALLHDVARPACRSTDARGQASARGQAAWNEIMARLILWRLGAPVTWREAVAALVLYHQGPHGHHLRPDGRRLAIRVSQAVRCDRLALLAEADARASRGPDQAKLRDGVAAFRETASAERCLDRPRAFLSDHARFLYFRDGTGTDRDPDAEAPLAGPGRVVLMTGLPGAGKEAWVRERCENWPICAQEDPLVPRDQGPGGWGGTRHDRTLDAPRALLRVGIPFVWFGTFLARRQRARALEAIAAAGAKVRIVHVEASEETIVAWNQRRARPLPRLDLSRSLGEWEAPDLSEAHAVDWLANP